MSEKINTRNVYDTNAIIPMDRDEFYKSQIALAKSNSKPIIAVDAVNIFLFNKDGDILVQKRSYDKKHNPGLIDKTIGGHVTFGDLPDYTAMIETIQELQVPSVVLKNKEDFIKTLKLLHNFVDTIAVMYHIDTKLFILSKIFGELETADIANFTSIYFGFYNGKVRPVDRESKGVLWYSIDELKNEIDKLPNAFTFDLKHYLKHYAKEINDFISIIKE